MGGLVMLIGGLLIAPAAWFLDLQYSYAAVKWACAHDSRAAVAAVPIGSLLLIAGGTWMSWSSFSRLRGAASDDGGRMEDRSYFLAVAGLALNAAFALLILLSLVPRLLLSPCE